MKIFLTGEKKDSERSTLEERRVRKLQLLCFVVGCHQLTSHQAANTQGFVAIKSSNLKDLGMGLFLEIFWKEVSVLIM